VTSFTDEDAPKGVELVYTVTAKNEAGESTVDDYTSAFLADNGLTDIGIAATTVRDNALARLPMELNSEYSVSQTIYYPADLKFARGTISSLVYKAYKGTSSSLSFPARIYMSETDMTQFESEWVGMDDAVKVFEGQVTLSQGSRDVEIKLTAPFEYNGGNLCVTIIKDGKNNGAYSDRFYSVGGFDENRSFTTSTYNPVDITQMPHGRYSDKAVGEIPSTRFIISLAHTGSISGTVTDAATAQPLKGASVSVAGFDGLTTETDASGEFALPIVPDGTQTLNVELTGYEPVSQPAEVTDGDNTNLAFKLVRRANYELKGTVLAGDTRTGASGAVISVSGYDEATCTADENGHWSLPGIYAGEDYTLKIAYPLYDIYTTTVNNDSETVVDAGTIMLDRSLIPAYGVDTDVNPEGTNVTITWLEPLSRTGEAGWKCIGDVATQSSTSGDYSASDYNVAHAFSPEDIADKQMEGLSITGMKIYLAASKGVFTATVWEGTRSDNTVLAQKTIPAELVTAAGGWVTVTFDEPVEIRKNTRYMVGVNCLDASNSPVGTAGYGSCVTDKNCLKWSDTEALYDGYYGWCIMAMCGVPGSESGIPENNSAPACTYNVYRSNLSDETPAWEKITPSPVSEPTFTDNGWSTIMSGNYRYAVTAVYQNGESMKALSGILPRSTDYDASVSAFISPAKSVDLQNEAEVKVAVTNYGEKTISDIPVELVIDGATHSTETLAATLMKGESAEISFGKVELSEGMHTFVATAKLPDDEQPANDACSFTLPNLKNVELTGYRWSAYGDAGFMRVQSNNPEAARYLTEVTPNDALIIAGEYFDGSIFAYTATWYGAPKEFVELDPDTWVVTRHVENTESYLLDMAYDYAGKQMYGLMPADYDVALVTIDLETGATSTVGILPHVMRTLACSTEGRLYGVTDNGDLYSIDKLTASATQVGPTGVDKAAYLQSMAFDHNTGRLFWAATSDTANGDIYEINPADGSAAKLGTTLFKATDPAEIVCLFTPYTHISSGVDTNVTAAAAAIGISLISETTLRVTSPANATVRIHDMP
ncbi:MAG: carboxypeptidase-like regulatory domain-containing protein, partial [Muribaculaceae bacterium]|nr:carboxypeptidase-like regulatory domain-containing protein [Muribaculaceae bacterium]